MTPKAILLSALIAASLSAAPLALAQVQVPQPAILPPPTAPKPPAAVTPPASAQPARPAPAATPQAQKVNLNTGAAGDLDKLPQIGAARAKVIIDERAKGRYKNWDDFVARMKGTTVNQVALDAIAGKVSF
jgi:competence protein ComEA